MTEQQRDRGALLRGRLTQLDSVEQSEQQVGEQNDLRGERRVVVVDRPGTMSPRNWRNVRAIAF